MADTRRSPVGPLTVFTGPNHHTAINRLFATVKNRHTTTQNRHTATDRWFTDDTAVKCELDPKGKSKGK